MKDITEDRINELKSSIHLLRSYLSVGFWKRKQIAKKELQKINQMYETNTNIKLRIKTIKKKKIFDKKNSQKIVNEKKKSFLKTLTESSVMLVNALLIKYEGSSTFLILSGSMNVEIDNKVVGAMSTGEIFGELSLILGDKRKQQ